MRNLLCAFVTTVLCIPNYSAAVAEDLWLADGKAFPGRIFRSIDGDVEQLIHRREAAANRAFPDAAMKVGQMAMSPEGNLYFCSGLDGYVLALQNGQHEILSFEFDGQIRDISCGDEEHTVYFSVVPTPIDGEPLADGKVYRRDIWEGQPAEVATIRQSDVAGNWWGHFSVKDGVIYLATFETQSRLFKLTSGRPEPVFPSNQLTIHGFTVVGDEFLIADGTSRVVKTTDFVNFTNVLDGENKFTDVAVATKVEQ